MTDDTITVSVSGTTYEIYNKLRGQAGLGGETFSGEWAKEMKRVADGGLMGGSLEAINFRLGVEVDEKAQRIVELEQEIAQIKSTEAQHLANTLDRQRDKFEKEQEENGAFLDGLREINEELTAISKKEESAEVALLREQNADLERQLETAVGKLRKLRHEVEPPEGSRQ